MKNISLIGLGKLGLPLATTFAKNNINVLAIDKNVDLIEKLKNGVSPWYEPNLEENLKLSEKNITYSDNYSEIHLTDVSIILVNTPSKENDGSFSNEYIIESLTEISKELKKNDKKNHLFILSSTVMPGSINNEFIPLIEKITDWKLNVDFGFCYIPDLVALGSVIKDFENPDVLVIGESNSEYGDIAEKIYNKIFKNNPPITKMSLIECEITKVSLNAYITMKISFANFIGNVAEKFNANPNNITKALGYDKRISPYYIKSGLSFGGTCFPRDTWAFIKMAEKIGLDAIHIKSTQKINEMQNVLLYEKVKHFKDKKIGIYGLSFKPNTFVTTESPGNILYEKLLNENYNVIFYDKLLSSEYTNNFDNFISDSNVIVITHDTKDFEGKNLNNKIIINPWRVKI